MGLCPRLSERLVEGLAHDATDFSFFSKSTPEVACHMHVVRAAGAKRAHHVVVVVPHVWSKLLESGIEVVLATPTRALGFPTDGDTD